MTLASILFLCQPKFREPPMAEARLPRIFTLGDSGNKGETKGQGPTKAGPWPFRELPGYPDGGSMTPSCCIMLKSSKLPQCSTILPSAFMRRMSIPVIVTRLPVGSMPMNSP